MSVSFIAELSPVYCCLVSLDLKKFHRISKNVVDSIDIVAIVDNIGNVDTIGNADIVGDVDIVNNIHIVGNAGIVQVCLNFYIYT